MGIEEEAIRVAYAKANNEKTLIDKLLARDDIDKLRSLVAKEKLTKNDVKEMLYLLNSAEAKLVNYSAQERYVMLKFHVWIRRVLKLFQMKEEGKEQLLDHMKELNTRCQSLLDDTDVNFIEQIQFVCDEYANIMRTSMSLNAMAFKEILTNKFEFSDQRQSLQQKANS